MSSKHTFKIMPARRWGKGASMRVSLRKTKLKLRRNELVRQMQDYILYPDPRGEMAKDIVNSEFDALFRELMEIDVELLAIEQRFSDELGELITEKEAPKFNE